MINAINIANMVLLQPPTPPKSLFAAPKSSFPLQNNPSRGTQYLPHLSTFLTRSISVNSVNISFRNCNFSAKCCCNSSSGEYEQDERTQTEQNTLQKQGGFDGTENQSEVLHFLRKIALPGVVALLPFVVDSEKAFAVSGEYGLLEGRSAALVHPFVMGSLFVYTLWAGYLGWQWRRVRTIQEEVNELKKQVKPRPKEEKDAPVPPSPIETKIQKLTEERKELLKGSFRDKHFNAGSILLGLGVLEAVGGGINTWMRTGKLFPGPHLFAGAGITILWALAAALVPAMQKGNDVARNLHIALNAANVLLFIWQIPTGIEIVLKVFEFTKWP